MYILKIYIIFCNYNKSIHVCKNYDFLKTKWDWNKKIKSVHSYKIAYIYTKNIQKNKFNII
jgi:hypothetical protein